MKLSSDQLKIISDFVKNADRLRNEINERNWIKPIATTDKMVRIGNSPYLIHDRREVTRGNQ